MKKPLSWDTQYLSRMRPRMFRHSSAKLWYSTSLLSLVVDHLRRDHVFKLSTHSRPYHRWHRWHVNILIAIKITCSRWLTFFSCYCEWWFTSWKFKWTCTYSLRASSTFVIGATGWHEVMEAWQEATDLMRYEAKWWLGILRQVLISSACISWCVTSINMTLKQDRNMRAATARIERFYVNSKFHIMQITATVITYE